MDIKTFKVERWMNEYEDDCTYNLAETCIDSLTVRELIEMAGLDTAEFMNELADTRMTYGHIFGSPELLEGIAGLYGELVETEHVIPMHGAIGANNHVIMALIDPSFRESILRKVGEGYLAEFPKLRGRYSAHICGTADGVKL